MILGQQNWEFLWSIKSMVCGFELSYVPIVNFHKSKVIGVNINIEFLKVVLDFLSCVFSHLQFTFLGIAIGKNPWRKSMQNQVLTKIRIRLASWKGKSVSLGGRVTLTNFFSHIHSLAHILFYIKCQILLSRKLSK